MRAEGLPDGIGSIEEAADEGLIHHRDSLRCGGMRLQLNPRPLSSGMPMVSKYSGLAQVKFAPPSIFPMVIWCPQEPPIRGTWVVFAAFTTPGIERTSSINCRSKSSI